MSEPQPSSAVAVFEDRRHAHLAVERLVAAGFSLDDIGYVIPEGEPIVEPPPLPEGSRASQGGATGAATGGALGGLLGVVLTAAIPGVGPVLAGGLLVGALTGAAGGGLLGTLMGLGVAKDHAEHSERHFHTGKTVVTVRAGARYDDAMKVLREAAESPEVVRSHPQARQLSDNDISPGSGSVFPGAE